MSNAERKGNLPAIIQTAEPKFTELARRHQVPDFTFAREAEFALQILNQNDFLHNVACGNPDSLKEAIINVAAVGLSLSPVHKQAYLVPRKKRVCLDISYKGFVDLATSRGAILWAKAEIVHEKDQFEFAGVNKEPIHMVKDLFGDRGPIVGGYCVAKMPTGDYLIDYMTIAEIHRIRSRSEAYKQNSGPWITDESEMIKKTLIRRAAKSWPKTVAPEVLTQAMAISDETDGVDFNARPAAQVEEPDPRRETGIQIIREFLEALDRTEEQFVEHLKRACNRQIDKLEDLTMLEIDQQVTFLEGVVEKQKERLEKLKTKDKVS